MNEKHAEGRTAGTALGLARRELAMVDTAQGQFSYTTGPVRNRRGLRVTVVIELNKHLLRFGALSSESLADGGLIELVAFGTLALAVDELGLAVGIGAALFADIRRRRLANTR